MPPLPPSPQSPINVAVLGFGLAGRVFHAPFVSAVPGLRLHTIVQRHGDEAATAYPEATTGVRIARSASDVFADPAIDLVVVGTPNETHFTLAQAALHAGKHVVVDKPLATSGDEIVSLIRLAQAQNLLLAPFHNRRWDGDFLTTQQMLSAGTLGRLVTFASRFDRFRPVTRSHAWKESDHPGNGLLFDLGPHLVDQALALFGTPLSLTASVRHEREGTAIEDAFDLTLAFPNGLRALLGATVIAAEPAPRFLLHGTSGSYRKFGVDPQEPALVAGARVPSIGSAEPWLREPETSFGQLALCPDPVRAPSTLTYTRPETQPGDYRGFYRNVLAAIRSAEPLTVRPIDAWRAVRVLELARQSSHEERTLPVDLTPPAGLLE